MATKSAFEKVFGDLQKLILKTKGLEGAFAFQFNIEGEVEDGAGAFFVKFENGELSVEPYDYTDNNGVFKATAETFKQLLTGKLDPADAIADGKLVVENNEAGAADIFRHIASFQGGRKAAFEEQPQKRSTRKAAEKEEPKPAAKEEAKPAVKAEAKPAPKAEVKPAADTKPAKGTKRGGRRK